MPRRQAEPIAAVRIELADEPSAIPAVASSVADAGGRIRTLSVVRRTPGPPPLAEIELEVEGCPRTARWTRCAASNRSSTCS